MIDYGIMWLGPLFILKREVVTICLIKPQYSNKQASISFRVRHGPQILTSSVSMILFSPLVMLVNPDTQIQPFGHVSVVPD